MKAQWYFDVISPFSYLYLTQLYRLLPELEVRFVPILFAGLLKRWGSKGPAEILSKRLYTYRHVVWLASRLDIPFKFPPAHPFNPLPALRLLVAAGATREHVETAFDMVWREGRDLQVPEELAELSRRLGTPITAVDDRVKRQLRANTDAAIKLEIFGVPTLVVNGILFWGQDSLEMTREYLRNPGLFETQEMQRALTLPVGAARLEASKRPTDI